MASMPPDEGGPHERSPTPAPPFSAVRPLIQHSEPLSGEAPVNLAETFHGQLGGAFSFMCTFRVDGLDSWARIFDFSVSADEDSITAGAIDSSHDLHFTIFRGQKPKAVHVPKFFCPGEESTVLCTVSAAGHMRVFKDGALVGENVKGHAPSHVDRPHLTVGSHFQHKGQGVRGVLKDVKVWDREVAWSLPGAESSQGSQLRGRAAGQGLTEAQKVGARRFAGIVAAYGAACAAVGAGCASSRARDRLGRPILHAGLASLLVSLCSAALAFTGVKKYASIAVPMGAMLFILYFVASILGVIAILCLARRRASLSAVGAGVAYAMLSAAGYLATKWNFSASKVFSNEGRKGRAIPIRKEKYT